MANVTTDAGGESTVAKRPSGPRRAIRAAVPKLPASSHVTPGRPGPPTADGASTTPANDPGHDRDTTGRHRHAAQRRGPGTRPHQRLHALKSAAGQRDGDPHRTVVQFPCGDSGSIGPDRDLRVEHVRGETLRWA